ncbi:Heat shock 70 kDa protein 12B [Mizuhopecten yessoensis]|uniref:Heat shock 70 kDa protein n=2 Tax=Mizuhopecten yessoensis TaxID=6573 RepID=A0A1C9U314_MIZYE|nr:heat shock 70 kDa protein [Mizuhopecten yessoensis]OWF38508.1 Heat shock 70 kDa protein 12B [Mizuhopecten yessoensis]
MAAAVDRYLFVAAIDFGTTYSGYAFSSKDAFEEDPLKISTNSWNSGSDLSYKAPTALLLTPKKEFKSFGYTAETDYTQMAEDGADLSKHYYFHRFKMLLHNNKNLGKKTKITDETGKSFPAFDVFVHSIRYLKDHVFHAIKNSFTDLLEKDMKYVLTVPAIWNDNAKQFMREAAAEAGIKGTQLMIALEPEAASIYCQTLPSETVYNRTFLKAANSGSTYMVVDLGGGTADITVHQRQGDRTLKELLPATGGALGGKSVDDEFWRFLGQVVGEKNLALMKKESMEDYIDLSRQFETKKREITVEGERNVLFTLPVTLLDIIKRDKQRQTIEKAIQISPFSHTVELKRKKLSINVGQFRGLFSKTINGILSHMETILYKHKFKHIQHILMVGGFSECLLLQSAIRKRLNQKVIVVPDEAGLAVLKGAVLFGHTPRAISCRVARYSYGTQSWPTFNPNVHPEKKRVVINGVSRCKDVFFKFIEANQELVPGHRESQVFQPLNLTENFLECTVYASPLVDPMFTDEDDCIVLGVLRIPLNPKRKKNLKIEETLIFGETELAVQARDIETEEIYETQFNLLKDGT